MISLPELPIQLNLHEVEGDAFQGPRDLREMNREFKDGNSVWLTLSTERESLLVGDLCLFRSWISKEKNHNHELLRVTDPFFLRNVVINNQRFKTPRVIPLKCTSNETESEPYSLGMLQGTPWEETLVGNQLADLSVEFVFRDSEGNGRKKFDPKPIGTLWSNFQQEVLKGQSHLSGHLSGNSSFQWHAQRAMQSDQWINIVAIALFFICFRLFLGTWQSGLWYLMTLTLTMTSLYGVMGFFQIPVDLINNCLFLMVCLASIQDFLFISQRQRSQPWRTSFSQLIVPSFFTSLTTVIGFGSLVISDLEIVQRFGFLAALGAIFEFFYTFFVWPVVMSFFLKDYNWTKKSSLQEVVKQFNHWTPPPESARYLLLWALISLSGFFFLKVEDHPRTTFPVGHIEREAYEHFSKTRGWETSFFLLFDQEIPREEIEKINGQILEIESVVKVTSPYELIDYLGRDKSESQKSLIWREIKGTPFYGYNFSEDETSRGVVFLKKFILSEVRDVLEKIKSICPERQCWPVGETVVYAEFTDKVVSTLFSSLSLCLFLVGGVLCFLIWSVSSPNGGVLILSSFWGPLVLIGFLALFQIPIQLVNSVFASVIVGLTGDNAIQYLLGKRELKQSLVEKGESSLIVTVIMCGVGLTFLGLTMETMKTLGVLLVLGLMTSLFGDLFLLKSLLRLKEKA